MDTNTPLNAQFRNRGIGSGRKTVPQLASLPSVPEASPAPSVQARPGEDWQSAGIVDQMLAYRDWWNLPVRRPQSAAKTR